MVLCCIYSYLYPFCIGVHWYSIKNVVVIVVFFQVILRYIHNPKPEVPAHIKLLDWVPQNDILAHPNMKLFITHCGANSQFEALYHAVPMLNFPFYADQPYNAKRADYKGYSRTLTMAGLNTSYLVENIQQMVYNDTYSKAISLGSRIS